MTELSESFYRSIVQNVADIVWVLSRDQDRIIYINRDFSGMEKDKILEQGPSSIWSLMDIPSLERFLEAVKSAVMRGEQIENVETVHTNRVTGSVEHFLNTVIPIQGSEGFVSNLQVVSTEITPFVNSRSIMKILNSVSEAMQRNLLSRNLFKVVGERLKKHDIFITIMLSPDGKTAHVAYTNNNMRKLKKALALLGKEKALKGIPIEMWRGVMHTIRDRRAQFWDDPYAFLISRLHDKSYKKNIGRVIKLLDVKNVIVVPMIANRVTVGSLNMFSDSLTEMDVPVVQTFAAEFSHALMCSRLYREVKQLEGYLETLLQNTGEGIFVIDENQHIVTWNRGASTLFGYSKADIIGEHIRTIGINEKTINGLFQMMAPGKEINQEQLRMRCRGGVSKEVALNAFPVEGNQRKHTGITMMVREIDPRDH